MNSYRLLPRLDGLVTVVGIALLWAPAALAGIMVSGQINAAFSNPVLAGENIALDGQRVFEDHSGTAVYSFVNNGSVAEVIWGDDNGGAGSPSEVVFFGNTVSAMPIGQEFQLGTVTFNNGTSTVGTSIFGATLTLFVPQDPSVTPLTTNLQILTTRNHAPPIPFLDADYLTFPAPTYVNFHVYEGAGATAIVWGRFVGDPELVITRLELAPDQVGNGFLSEAPEPSSWILMGSGVLLFAAFRGLSRRGTSTR